VLILNDKQIRQKIKRLALEIVEKNHNFEHIIILGINNKGYLFAKLIAEEVEKIHDGKTLLRRLKINPAHPLDNPVTIDDLDGVDLTNSSIVLADDVANTGRTLFYAFKPLMESLMKSLQVAVLVDRKHKTFPIQTDFVGLSLATTYDENIKAHLSDPQNLSVTLE
jgi:pyrimidine operon attenuation protein/uracil phosphoribosyltransferase